MENLSWAPCENVTCKMNQNIFPMRHRLNCIRLCDFWSGYIHRADKWQVNLPFTFCEHPEHTYFPGDQLYSWRSLLFRIGILTIDAYYTLFHQNSFWSSFRGGPLHPQSQYRGVISFERNRNDDFLGNVQEFDYRAGSSPTHHQASPFHTKRPK